MRPNNFSKIVPCPTPLSISLLERLDELRNPRAIVPPKLSCLLSTKTLPLSKKTVKLTSAFFVIVKTNDLLRRIYIRVDSKRNNRSWSCVSNIQIIDNWDIAVNDIQ